ncbi:MAG TPA: polysaccharide biosynthesis/export family protein [Thermodesulfobacteriota bacterium]
MQRSARLFVGVVLLAAATGCASPTPPRLVGGTAADEATPTSATYTIGPEDVLMVSVWKEEGLTRQVRVRPDGFISFPLVGEVRAAGLTAAQLQADLTRRLQAYVTAPAVSVIVEEINSYKVFVLGEVERPGLVPARSQITVLQALSLAGGLKPFADGDRMVLVREVDGKTVRVRLNYRDLVLGRNGAVNLVLESGDTLVVP